MQTSRWSQDRVVQYGATDQQKADLEAYAKGGKCPQWLKDANDRERAYIDSAVDR